MPQLGIVLGVKHEEAASARSDQFAALSIQDGIIVAKGLKPGDYDLHLKASGERIRIRVVAGVKHNGYILGSTRNLEQAGLPPLHIESITSAGSLTIPSTDWSGMQAAMSSV